MRIMKSNSVITFNVCKGSLSSSDYKELWIGESFEERQRKLLDVIIEKNKKNNAGVEGIENKDLLPSPNMQYIREVIFSVDDTVTIDAIREIIPSIAQRFDIECFQIAIDRQANQAHLLFDWYSRSKGECVYLYPSKKMEFTVFLMRELKLPHTEESRQWLKRFLIEEYSHDQNIFKTLMEGLKPSHYGQHGFYIMRVLIQLGEYICKGQVR
ncbi:MAG: hypothetical protein IJL94_01290 [Erysipelotrichaceae bacterium]|nr:hypothetical protein [Erysipelotrichaceae bacterium]